MPLAPQTFSCTSRLLNAVSRFIAIVVILAASASAQAQRIESWPRWRGVTGQGVAAAGNLPDEWPAEIEPLWKAPLGAGWSSPVVAEGRVFVTDRADHNERVFAFDADSGDELWRRATAVDFDPHQVGARHGNGPKSTPAVSAGKVYTLGIAGRLQCLDAATGKPLWEVNFPARFGVRSRLAGGRAYVNGVESVIVPIGKGEGAPVPLFGYTGSVLVAGGLVVVPVGGARAGTIMAFDAHTGKEAWRALDDEVSYSSPVVDRLGGIEQVVVMTGPEVVGLELTTGRKLWGHPFQIQYNESISTPVVSDPYVVVTGDGRPLTAFKISKNGSGCSLEVAWQNRDLSSYLSSMIVHDGYIYGMNDGGEFCCLRLTDGKTLWLQELHHGYYCTPVLVGSKLLCLNEQGELLILLAAPKASPQLGLLKLTDRATWTSPALVGSRLYIRAHEQLLAFELAP
jgi:outer membrane protein assembly factor BamB